VSFWTQYAPPSSTVLFAVPVSDSIVPEVE
jgi:hypothetical protein